MKEENMGKKRVRHISTYKKILFAKAIVANGGNATAAYREVYNVGKDRPESVTNIKACELRAQKVVQNLIEEEQANQQVFDTVKPRRILKKLHALADTLTENGKEAHATRCYAEINKMMGYHDLPLRRLFNLNDYDTLAEKQEGINTAYNQGVISLDEFKAFIDSIKSVDMIVLSEKVQDMLKDMDEMKK